MRISLKSFFRKLLMGGTLAAAAWGGIASSHAALTLSNGGFESPAVRAGYGYNSYTAGTNWTPNNMCPTAYANGNLNLFSNAKVPSGGSSTGSQYATFMRLQDPINLYTAHVGDTLSDGNGMLYIDQSIGTVDSTSPVTISLDLIRPTGSFWGYTPISMYGAGVTIGITDSAGTILAQQEISYKNSYVGATPFKVTGGLTWTPTAAQVGTTVKFFIGSRLDGHASSADSNSAAFDNVQIITGSLPTQPLALTWTGAGSPATEWSTAAGVLNWNNGTGSAAYVDGSDATFGNSTSTLTVDVATGGVAPNSTTFNNDASHNYTLQGGAITGSGGLNKLGAGTLTILNNNTFTAATTILGGTLKIGNGGTIGSIGTSPIVNYGTLEISRSDDLSMGAVIGTGTLVKSGSNTVTLTENNSVSGDITVTQGTLTLAQGGLAISGSSTVRNITGAGALNVPNGGLQGWTGTTNLNVGTCNLQYVQLGQASGQAHTLNIQGGTINVSGIFKAGHWGSETSVVNMSGGTLNFTGAAVTDPNEENQNNLIMGIDGTGVLNQSGGIINTQSFVLDNRGNTSETDIYSLTGGRLNVGKWGIRSNNPTYSVELGGGTVSASANWSSSLNMGLTGKNGDVTFDTNGYGITLTGTLSDWYDPINYELFKGGLIKTGNGTLTLSGSNSYTGTTRVNGGILALTTSPNTGEIIVNSGGTLATNGAGYIYPNVTVNANGNLNPGISGTPNALVLNTLVVKKDANLNFQLGGTGTTTADSLNVSAYDGLTIDSAGAAKINVSNLGGLAAGTYMLLDYSNTSSAFSGFVLGSHPRIICSLFDNAPNSSIDLIVTGATTPKWVGNANPTANWDTVASNLVWNDGSPTYYMAGDSVTFDDTATGTTSIVLGSTVAPTAMTVNNDVKQYSIAGAGKISGGTGIIKKGSKKLILDTTNDFTGPLTINGGTVQLGTGSTTGGIASSVAITLAAGTTLAINRSDDTTLSNVITGDGSLVKDGAGTLTIPQAENYTGGTTVNGGTLIATAGGWYSARSIGSGLLTVNNGATAIFTAAHGFGVGNGGMPAVINGGTLQFGLENYVTSLTMTGGTLQGAGEARMLGPVTVVASTATATISTTTNLMGSVTYNVADGGTGNDLLVSGNVFGGGSILKTGAGVMRMTGTNTNSGLTTANAGTLFLGNGSATNSIPQGAIGANGTGILILKSETTQSVASFAGNGRIENQGGAIVAKGGSSAFTGTLQLNAQPVTIKAESALGVASSVLTNGNTFTFDFQFQPLVDGKLLEGVVSGNANWISTPSTTTATNDFSTYINGTTIGTSQTAVYTGQIHLTVGTWSFAENFDDSAYLKINGTEILNNNAWETPTAGKIDIATAGWYSIDLRVGNDTGGKGSAWASDPKWGIGVMSGDWTVGGTNTTVDQMAFAPFGDLTPGYTLQIPLIDKLTEANNFTLTGTNVFDTSLVTGGTGKVVLSGNIGGTGGLTKSGAIPLELTGTLDYTGVTTINSGTLVINNGKTSTLSTIAGAGNLTVVGNSTLNVTSLVCDTLTIGAPAAVAAVPEPSTLVLLVLGAVALVGYGLRRR